MTAEEKPKVIGQSSLVSVSILIGACGYTAWLFTTLAGLKEEIRGVGADVRVQMTEVRTRMDQQELQLHERWSASDHRRWELELGRLNPTLILPGDK